MSSNQRLMRFQKFIATSNCRSFAFGSGLRLAQRPGEERGDQHAEHGAQSAPHTAIKEPPGRRGGINQRPESPETCGAFVLDTRIEADPLAVVVALTADLGERSLDVLARR